MKHFATSSFWQTYQSLPDHVRKAADRRFELLKSNKSHPSLQFKKVGKLWSARVSLNYRALALEHDNGYAWIWIGRHEDYERLLSEKK